MTLVSQSDFKCVWMRKDGILKIEVYDFGCGKRYNGTPATGHWKTRGFKKDGIFEPTLRELKERLK